MAMTTIDEQVHLEKYDPVWPQRFQAERDRIWVAFGWEASAVEHIGSTVVSGLRAKPIVDLMHGFAQSLCFSGKDA